MQLPRNLEPEEVVRQCGRYREAVEAIVNLARRLWDSVFAVREDEGAQLIRASDVPGLQMPAWLGGDASSIILEPCDCQPLALARAFVGDIPSHSDHELRYYATAAIRRHHGFYQSSQFAHWFHLLARAVNAKIAEKERQEGLPTPEVGQIWSYRGELQRCLEPVLRTSIKDSSEQQKISNLFLECCRVVDYVRAYDWGGRINVRPKAIDAEYLLSNCLGLPTGIPGFDNLFGGGGPMLGEARGDTPEGITARTILTVGRFGTGKSLLSLQIALEVARKGGIAWVMPLEQMPEECLYALESVSPLPHDVSVGVASTSAEVAALLERNTGKPGALIILGTVKEYFGDFLLALETNIRLLEPYPLRLIVIDPVNAIRRGDGDESSWRQETLDMFHRAKRLQTNLWLVEEEAAQGETRPRFEQNIADTVIRLFSEEEHGYAQRYIEVRKSRLQREQRGRHALSIVPGHGIVIYPSSASVNARIRPRRIRLPDKKVHYGLEALDDVLGPDAISAGDVIALKGPRGCYKIPLGLLFLLATDDPREERGKTGRPASLLVAVGETEPSIRQLLKEACMQVGPQGLKGSTDVFVCSFGSGYIKPGQILQRIEEELLRARVAGQLIDRVMIEGISHWDSNCPFVKADTAFGDTLVDLLRRHWVTSLLTCREVDSPLQQSLLDNADCVMEFDRKEFRGVHRVVLRVLKTRGMNHKREWFELVRSRGKLEVKPSWPLLRVRPDGEVTPVKIRLFLHSESQMQASYNDRFHQTIRSVLSPEAVLEPQRRMFMRRAMGLGFFSAVDELQLLQLDEFQVPRLQPSGSAELTFHQFPNSAWDEAEWNDSFPRFTARVRSADQGFIAVPLYANVSLLAHRKDVHLPKHFTWEWLADQCTSRGGALFFEYPEVTVENYNCLFFEILLSLNPEIPHQPEACGLRAWLTGSDSLKASDIFRRLCRPAHLAKGEPHASRDDESNQLQSRLIDVRRDAKVWRHWYSTLNQMMAQMEPEERREIQVKPLPGKLSTSGEWYLAIPAYSAAPDVGLHMIKLLTSRAAELERVMSGVGLPTRQTFYGGGESRVITVSPFFSMGVQLLGHLVEKAFERSQFACYTEFSGILGSYLRELIEIPDGRPDKVKTQIREKLETLKAGMDFVIRRETCARCTFRCSQNSGSR